ncbi:SPARC-related modular calcium-binding protein 2 isoform X1 [Wyeomyia smithii]|uniref:SPARC-related modular calcium-binding protein 2 isoform X1 n=1 Tax=Wyeomyia smithii TaxID=174621 RepID=UPI0024681A56|nr:SPARC-related modular calcium-binding protein 2 isoform X1 [Wyeomyia smithii]XP_055529496.1 SPARC-related modular calcium-binding protein 2 isoform X1 [Wyeomyia smithii]XP_055529497.1 SPARC-related modular calcium-binding protein 2 isoform X1 [Wyeomyia smithii]XP_055529498.1 SPARC-related modular calcium-binding protein 2 isoform X1 [Wyeomyia smithii]
MKLAVACLAVLVLHGVLAIPPKSEPTISECTAKGGECDESKGRPVCGTDNQTYPTRCHLIRAQCSGHQVSLKHRGTCKDVCLASRTYALQHRSSSAYGVKFVPRCREDGTYAPVQCLESVGCWCVNSQGKPLPNTTVQHGKPVCVKKGKSNQRRSSPRNPVRNKRSCSRMDRALFNRNLLKLFENEHIRVQHNVRGSLTAMSSAVSEKTVLDWKFGSMDGNKNGMLDKSEYRELKRLIKKVVKPKRCGRSFGKSCDVDQDERLSRLEWSNCFSKDNLTPEMDHYPSHSSSSSTTSGGTTSGGLYATAAHHHHHHQGAVVGGGGGGGGTLIGVGGSHSSSSSSTHHHHSFLRYDESQQNGSSQDYNDFDDEDDYSENDDDSDELPDSDNTLLNGLHFSIAGKRLQPNLLLQGKTTLELKGEQDPIFKDSEAESDCLSDRAAALEEQGGATALYVPECTADGRYQRVQCYRSTGYCWCVHEDTGKNIPGTSTKDQRPQCDVYPGVGGRQMRGCPDDKKLEFLKDLKDFLKQQIASNSVTAADNTKWGTEDEKIATLSFVLLDKNKNKVWERKEWKTFRELVTAARQLRKCGKKMPRYCDVNNDRKITLSEWLNCLQTQRTPYVLDGSMSKVSSSAYTSTSSNGNGGSNSGSSMLSGDGWKPSLSASSTSKFRGPNPLESVLKSD